MPLDFARIADALRHEPLVDVAAHLGLDPAALRDALVAEGRDRGAQDAVWWPEALRRLETGTIRSVAKYFLCEPRRIRRALAREGLRVAGVPVTDRRVPQLQHAPLGDYPDADIARRNRVIPQAVAGERRRRNIRAYQPGKRRRWTPVEPEVVRVAHAPEDVVTPKSRREESLDSALSAPPERVVDTFRERERRVRQFMRREREETVVRSVDVRKDGRRVPSQLLAPKEAPLPELSSRMRRTAPPAPARRTESAWRSVAADDFFVEPQEAPPEPTRAAPPVVVEAPARVAPLRTKPVPLPLPATRDSSNWRAVFAAGPHMHLESPTLAGALDEARARAGADPLRVERLAG